MSRTGGRVLLVIGTRPEVIKLAPVHRALQARAPELEVRIALTGQHSALVDEALEVFGLRPHWDLELMREGQTLSEVAVGCLEGVGRVVREWPPDLLLVQGDTASVFFGALASWMHGVPVGHVEAGLRTGDTRQTPRSAAAGNHRLVYVLLTARQAGYR